MTNISYLCLLLPMLPIMTIELQGCTVYSTHCIIKPFLHLHINTSESIHKDIILSDKDHHPALRPCHVKAYRQILAWAVPLRFISMYFN